MAVLTIIVLTNSARDPDTITLFKAGQAEHSAILPVHESVLLSSRPEAVTVAIVVNTVQVAGVIHPTSRLAVCKFRIFKTNLHRLVTNIGNGPRDHKLVTVTGVIRATGHENNYGGGEQRCPLHQPNVNSAANAIAISTGMMLLSGPTSTASSTTSLIQVRNFTALEALVM